jgi:putative redox protein
MRVDVAWKGELAFEATPPTGFRFTMDGHPESGGQGLGPTPMEALLAAAAACSAMDVVSILEKKRQNVTAYRIEIEGERPPEGEWPRPFTRLTVRHIVSGVGLDPAAVERAVELSDTKYCSVLATLRAAPDVTSSWQIED